MEILGACHLRGLVLLVILIVILIGNLNRRGLRLRAGVGAGLGLSSLTTPAEMHPEILIYVDFTQDVHCRKEQLFPTRAFDQALTQ